MGDSLVFGGLKDTENSRFSMGTWGQAEDMGVPMFPSTLFSNIFLLSLSWLYPKHH